MYIDIVPNRNSRPAVLLREGWREGQRIRKRTLANLTSWPAHKVMALRRLLKDEPWAAPGELFAIEQTLPHGHVEAVLGTIRRLGLDGVIASKPSRRRDLVLAMIAEQVIHPSSKLGTTRLWHTTTLAQELGVSDADADELYEAMDWLVARQGRMEKNLLAGTCPKAPMSFTTSRAATTRAAAVPWPASATAGTASGASPSSSTVC